VSKVKLYGAVAVLLALIAVPGAGRRIAAERIRAEAIVSDVQASLLADGSEALVWVKADGSCVLVCRTSATPLTLAASATAEQQALSILRELYSRAPDTTTLYAYIETNSRDAVTIELTAHSRKQVMGCVCNIETGACCQGSAVVVELDSLELARLQRCQELTRSGFDTAVLYVQNAASAWRVEDVLTGFAATTVDWSVLVPYAGPLDGSSPPSTSCDRQVTIVVAEVESCPEGSACYRIRAGMELLNLLLDRLCATRVVLVLIQSDGSLLDAVSMMPSLGGPFDSLYLVPVDASVDQARALAALLASLSGGVPDMRWLLGELRSLSFEAIYRPADAG
jgi:hypothetical protein